MPWTLHYSTHVVNPSYVLPGALVFFLGFLETFPATSGGVLRLPAAAALMGFGVCWVMQVHLSWVLLVPFASLAVLVFVYVMLIPYHLPIEVRLLFPGRAGTFMQATSGVLTRHAHILETVTGVFLGLLFLLKGVRALVA